MYTQSLPLSSTASDLRSGRLDLVTYIDETCKRLSEVDQHIMAMLPEEKRLDRLHMEAIELQKRFPYPKDRPPLYGILVAIKDIFPVDGFDTRVGSNLPAKLFQGPEALCVKLLRNAGALILGKAVTAEFAYIEPGPTCNPHNIKHTPGGSSSGSAAAVAAGICPLAIGTQTIGSTIRPAAYCGITGFKPSIHRIPTNGLIHFSRTADQVGLFTQDPVGMAIACSILCQSWRNIKIMDKAPKLGVPVGPYLDQADEDGLKAFEKQLKQLEKIGCKIKEIKIFDNIKEIVRIHNRMIYAEFVQEHKGLLLKFSRLLRPKTIEAIKIGQTVNEEELNEARNHCSKLRSQLELKMALKDIELWVCPPACGPAPLGLDSTGDPNMNLPWNHTGMPTITIPFGLNDENLPLGIQIISAFGSDEYLLKRSQWLMSKINNLMTK